MTVKRFSLSHLGSRAYETLNESISSSARTRALSTCKLNMTAFALPSYVHVRVDNRGRETD